MTDFPRHRCDQSPMEVISSSKQRRHCLASERFPDTWTICLPERLLKTGRVASSALPTGKPIPALGMACQARCLAPPRTDSSREEPSSASFNGSCTILYDRETQPSPSGEFHLTSVLTRTSIVYGQRRFWTPLLREASTTWLSTSDGYMVTIGLRDGLFLLPSTLSRGKYSGPARDTSRQYAHLLVGAGDGFYLIGAGPKDRYSLHVIRGR